MAEILTFDTIKLHRADSFEEEVRGLGDISARTKLWWTVKKFMLLDDSSAAVQVEETAGLAVLNGVTEELTAENGSITVDDATAGVLTLGLDAAVTAALTPGQYYYDLKMLSAEGAKTLAQGVLLVSAGVTRAVA